MAIVYGVERDVLRSVVLAPYRKGMGPKFRLVMWHASYAGGRDRLGYDFRELGAKYPIFTGEDFGPSPMHSIDGDEAVAGLMGFLTLRPGDTDDEYFRDYTDEQLAFAQQHGEAVGMEAVARFGED